MTLMRARNLSCILVTPSTLLFAAPLLAQDTAFTYQERLNDGDLHGAVLADIQGLDQKLELKETEIVALKQRFDALEKLVRSQK